MPRSWRRRRRHALGKDFLNHLKRRDNYKRVIRKGKRMHIVTRLWKIKEIQGSWDFDYDHRRIVLGEKQKILTLSQFRIKRYPDCLLQI